MKFIPLDPEDEDVKSLLDSFGKFPLSFVAINNPGDYEKENIVFEATEEISSLYGFILFYSVEDIETGIPDYSQCRFLSFADIELQKGSRFQVYTRKGEDSADIDFETTALNNTIYWGLPAAIWHIPHSSYELMKRSDSIGGGLLSK